VSAPNWLSVAWIQEPARQPRIIGGWPMEPPSMLKLVENLQEDYSLDWLACMEVPNFLGLLTITVWDEQ